MPKLAITQHEYSLDNGVSFNPCTIGMDNGDDTATISGITGAVPAGHLIVRRIGETNPAKYLRNASAFTDTGVTYNPPQTGDITFADADFNYSIPGYAKTGYTARSTAGYVEFKTTETALDIKIGGNWSGNGVESDIEVLVDGVYNQSVRLTADDTTQSKPITLPAGEKLVRLVNGFTAVGASDILPANGVFVQGVVTTGDIEVKTPADVAVKRLFMGDSITAGAAANHPAISGYATLFRSLDNWKVQVDAWGARRVTADTPADADLLAAHLSGQLNGTTTNELFIALGTNNFGLTNDSAVWFKVYYEYMLDAIHTLRPDVQIWLITPLNRSNYTTANSSGFTVEDFADAIKEMAADRPTYCKYIYGKTLVSLANMPDGLHPNQTGHDEYHTNLLAKYLAGGDSTGAGNTTPAAPTISADDTANTLSASHALGDSEILESENNGTYVAYSGAKAIGDVALAAGYWKFKIKAATGRDESAVASSPAFTVAGGGGLTVDNAGWLTLHDPGRNVTTRTAGADTFAVSVKDQKALADTGRELITNLQANEPKLLTNAVNGQTVLHFDTDTSNLFTGAINGQMSKPFTRVAYVQHKVIGSGVRYSLTSRSGSTEANLGYYTGKQFMYAGNILYEDAVTHPLAVDTGYLVWMEFAGDGSTDKMYINGDLVATGNAGTSFGLDGFKLGDEGGTTANSWIGIHAMKEGLFSAGDRAILTAELKTKYGIA